MAFQTGSATGLSDLFDKLLTFATANGWTEDEDTAASKPALHKGDVYVQFRYDGTSVSGFRSVAMYQALAYNGSGTNPGSHTDDSGNGHTAASATNASLEAQRCISDVGDGPFPNYWFFENDASPAYIHVVLEVRSDEFRHFGFGNIEKFGDWTGGEYAYAHYQTGTNGARMTSATCLLDGLFNSTSPTSSQRRAATLHIEGMPGQPAASKWGQVWNQDATPSDDRAGESKLWILGGFRGGPIPRNFGVYNGAASDGLVPMYQIGLWYVDEANGHVYWLGHQPDVRALNIRNFDARSEIVIGGDTWIIFPMSIRTATTSLSLSSAYSGIAYKKVTA